MSTNRQRTSARKDAQVVVVPTLTGKPSASFAKKINQIVLRGFRNKETPEQVAQRFLQELRLAGAKNLRRGRGIGPLTLSTQALCNSFKLEILDGVHLAADTYKIALYTSSATLSKSTTVYTTTGEVAAGGGYTAGGQNLSGRSAALDGDTAVLDFADAQWAASTITARSALIYNSTRSNKAVAVLDFGSDIVSTNGNFNVVFPAATAAAGLIRIA